MGRGLKIMCGIGGYQLRDNVQAAPAILARMQDMLSHRGPDGKGVWKSSDGMTGFAHTRLAILDLTEAGRQPMSSADGGLTITFNGEIYNWRELRNELRLQGCRFRSQTDTEVLLAGYQVWGTELVQRIRGMYAFALWDDVRKLLFCARDHIGKKPFLYSESTKGFFFSSEIPPLLATARTTDLDTGLDHTGLATMLLRNIRHIPEPNTAFRGIRKLRPGHAVIVKEGKIDTMWRHWQPTPILVADSGELRTLFNEAVALRSVADVPVAALLSGGMDSTAIVHLMQRYIGHPVRTYAFGLDGADEDILRARFAAKRLGTLHREYFFESDSQLETLKRLLTVYGEPVMLLPLIHASQLSQAIRADGVKVVLNGNGADELFFGYTGHLRTARVSWLLNRFGPLFRLLPTASSSTLRFLAALPGRRKAALYSRQAHRCWPLVLREEAMFDLRLDVVEEMLMWGEILPHRDFIDESNYISLLIENSHSLTIASDLPAMLHGVEMRSPFLDSQLIGAAMGIHYRRKVKGPKDGSGLKAILREAVVDLVPAELLHAPKRGFGMGVQERDVLLGPWRRQADTLLNDFPLEDLFDGMKIRSLWNTTKRKGSGPWSLLAKLFGIGLWKYEVTP